MTRTHEDPDGVGRVVELFPAGSRKAVERLLQRARENAARQAGQAVQRALEGQARPSMGMGRLTCELGRALSRRGAATGRTSIRQVSPTSGGRSFHFAHSVIKKSDGPRAARGAQAGAEAPEGVPAPGGRRANAAAVGRAAAHMRYIEREVAVERLYGQGERPGKDRHGRGEGRERDPAEVANASGASAGQGYVENPAKLENGEQVVFSFGTIGERFEERLAFWDALEQAESHPEARVQHRLILELPHEASPEARFEMVRRFCGRFEDDGVPFWAALHAPGPKNDSRNFHAHIVYSERPAKRMTHPETGETVWDFEVMHRWTDSSRHARTSRPHRQNKLRPYHAKDFIRSRRADFAAVVNEVLARDGVTDRLGRPVRYDARSYAAMGVDGVPMRSINRIVADRARDGAATVLDADYTNRMIAAELRDAAARRDKDVLELVALDGALRAVTATGKAAVKLHDQPAVARRLPQAFRGSDLWKVPRAVLKAASDGYMAARHEALRTLVMERATTAALERIVEATAPEALAATARGKAGKAGPVVPDMMAARLLHEATLDEMAEVKLSADRARAKTKRRVAMAAETLHRLVNPAPAPSKVLKDMLRRRRQAIAPVAPARAPEAPSSRRAPEVGRPHAGAGAGREGQPDRGTALEMATTPGDAAAAPAGQAEVRPAPSSGRVTPTGPVAAPASIAASAEAGGAATDRGGRPAPTPQPASAQPGTSTATVATAAKPAPSARPSVGLPPGGEPAKPTAPSASPTAGAAPPPPQSTPVAGATGERNQTPPGLKGMTSSLQPMTSVHLQAVSQQASAFIRAAYNAGTTAEERGAMLRQMMKDFGGMLADKRAVVGGLRKEEERRARSLGLPTLADIIEAEVGPAGGVPLRQPAKADDAAKPSAGQALKGPRRADDAATAPARDPTTPVVARERAAPAGLARSERTGTERSDDRAAALGRDAKLLDGSADRSGGGRGGSRVVSEGDIAATTGVPQPTLGGTGDAVAGGDVFDEVETDFGAEPELSVDEAALDAADDARRRKEALKKQKQRKAVLGRKARGRGIGE